MKQQTASSTAIRAYAIIGSTASEAVLYDNATARALAELLPLTVTLSDYDDVEKCCCLPYDLPHDTTHMGHSPRPGDIVFYPPCGCLSVFYRDDGYASDLICLGRITGSLAPIHASGSVMLTLVMATDACRSSDNVSTDNDITTSNDNLMIDSNRNFRMYVPTNIMFGPGELNRLHEQKLPGRKALIVISNGRATKTNGYLARVENELNMAGCDYAIFDKTEPNPLKDTVMAGGADARMQGCDFIVALGGGSVMDAAKAIAVMATNDGDYWEYVQRTRPVTNKPLPVVAITTTAGTGSEADPFAVISHPELNQKVGFCTADMFPVLSVVDPELMLTVPPMLTAFQGFDALFHSIECYISRKANLISDMYALTAIEYAAAALPVAVTDGTNTDARTRMALANTLSGVVMTLSSCTSEHSLEHAMSAYHQALPHGAGLIMISRAYFTHFVNSHVCDDRFIRMAQAMGMKEASSAADFITALTRLQEACGVDGLRMSDYGITTDEFAVLARNAYDTMGALFDADRSTLSIDDCIAIYRASYR